MRNTIEYVFIQASTLKCRFGACGLEGEALVGAFKETHRCLDPGRAILTELLQMTPMNKSRAPVDPL